MLGFSTMPKIAAERSREFVARGSRRSRCHLPFNERADKEGLRRNVMLKIVALASTYGYLVCRTPTSRAGTWCI